MVVMQVPFKKSNAERRVMMEVYMGRRVEQVTFVLGIVEVSQVLHGFGNFRLVDCAQCPKPLVLAMSSYQSITRKFDIASSSFCM